MYLAGAGKISQELKISKAEAQEYINAYFNEAKGLKEWLDKQIAFVKENGYVKSVFGRLRRVPEVFSTNQYVSAHAIKSAVNFLIQSPTNDINMIAFCRLMDRVKQDKIPFKPFTLVHDSIVGEVPDIEVARRVKEIFIEEISKIFPDAFMPIGVDAEIGESWGELTITI